MRPYIIGVAGGSGSGKTTVVENIVKLAGPKNIAVLPHDNYYRSQDEKTMTVRQQTNYDHPDSLETDLLLTQLDQLLAGKSIRLPQYNFSEHTRSKNTKLIAPRPVIVVEGILIFNSPELRDRCDFKVFVDTDPDVRLARRLQRDVAERGRTFEFSLAQYLRFTRPMHLEFVEPTKRFADIIIPEGGFNERAMAMLNAHVKQLLASLTPMAGQPHNTEV